jgi:hypothetical protein
MGIIAQKLPFLRLLYFGTSVATAYDAFVGFLIAAGEI